jgi:ribosomal protein S18 acetylase RimI-like enzyme
MSCEGIEFREGTASMRDIQSHLEECDGDFLPRLSLKINIEEYSRKISARAKTFEAWSGKVLVGLVAAYLNDRDTRIGFLTNMSVAKKFMGRGIATVLLDQCLSRSRLEGMKAVRLEVSVENREAIRLYRNFAFSEFERRGDTVFMEVAISERRQ